MKTLLTFICVAVVSLFAGCETFNKSAIALVDVEASAMKEWARLHNDNRTTDEFDRKIVAAHEKFKQSCAIAAGTLRAYQAGGDKAVYIKALEAARETITPLLDLLQPFLLAETNQRLREQQSLANTPGDPR